jgi:hypothetical protein
MHQVQRRAVYALAVSRDEVDPFSDRFLYALGATPAGQL